MLASSPIDVLRVPEAWSAGSVRAPGLNYMFLVHVDRGGDDSRDLPPLVRLDTIRGPSVDGVCR
jgi:hypothetical protein